MLPRSPRRADPLVSDVALTNSLFGDCPQRKKIAILTKGVPLPGAAQEVQALAGIGLLDTWSPQILSVLGGEESTGGGFKSHSAGPSG